jgi:hypothetical protein
MLDLPLAYRQTLGALPRYNDVDIVISARYLSVDTDYLSEPKP